MSEENVEVVRRLLEAYDRGDMEGMISLIDPDGELHSAIVGGAEGSVYRGTEGFRKWYADAYGSFEELRNEWSEFRDLGDRVLALGHVKARARKSGVELDSPLGWLFTVRDGKVVRSEFFLSHAHALKAAGFGSR